MKRLLILTLLVATPVLAQTQVASTKSGTIVAHDGVIELYDEQLKKIWSADGVSYASRIAFNEREAAVFDPLGDYVRIVDLASGAARQWRTGATPIDGAFVNGKLFALCRDDQTLERSDGEKLDIGFAADLIRASDSSIYLYSRVDGLFLDVDAGTMMIVQKAQLVPYAVDFEVDEHYIYFAHPNSGLLRTLARTDLKPMGEVQVSTRPVDIDLAAGPTPLTARTLAVADPALRQVVMVHAWQSSKARTVRLLLRGALGLPPPKARRAEESVNGPDRVIYRGDTAVAHEVVTGALWPVRKNAQLIATGVAPGAWDHTGNSVVWWDGKTLRRSPV